MKACWGIGLLVVLATACGGERATRVSPDSGIRDSEAGGGHDANADATTDAGRMDSGRLDGRVVCSSTTDCDDDVFCNGVELCAPMDPRSNANGCIPGDMACGAGETCDEATARCLSRCDLEGDSDMDGHGSIDCGGDDCDDSSRSTYPTAPELCNSRDDDCDGEVDEGLATLAFHPDCDGDGFGEVGSAPVLGCGPPTSRPTCAALVPASRWVQDASDCDDRVFAIHPGAFEERCDAVDNNCDGVLAALEDADRDGVAGSRCGGSDCDDADVTIYPGAPEVCDGKDNDCSLPGLDASHPADPSEDVDGDMHAPLAASCVDGPYPKDDCDDAAGAVHGGHAELCDGVDNDCDGATDEEPDASADCATRGGRATVMCVGGECVESVCPAGWNDCNGDPVLTTGGGCESQASTDALNCGACGSTCFLSCLSSECDDAVAVVVGYQHGCALLGSGRVVCWGDNRYGQLGVGAAIRDSNRPLEVSGLTDAVEISSGFRHMCARRASGRLVCWGANNAGQLGDGTTTMRFVPVGVPGVNDAVELSAGGQNTCARRGPSARVPNEVVCWGQNTNGQLTDYTTTDRSTPVAIPGLVGTTAISTGFGHICALAPSGQVRCWGDNGLGQLGDGTTLERHAPTTVSGLTDAVAVDAGATKTCAIRASGQAMCWGAHDEEGTTFDTSPVNVPGLSDAVEIRPNASSTCARRASGQAVCWGWNFRGALGDGTTISSATPVNVVGLADAVMIARTGHHGCAVRGGPMTSGSVVCWGAADRGDLGNGSTMDQSAPSPVLPLL